MLLVTPVCAQPVVSSKHVKEEAILTHAKHQQRIANRRAAADEELENTLEKTWAADTLCASLFGTAGKIGCNNSCHAWERY